MVCSKCGTENKEGAKFCRECGEELAAPAAAQAPTPEAALQPAASATPQPAAAPEPQPAAAEPGEQVFCSQCGTANKAGSQFCKNCGAQLKRPAAQPQAQAQPQAAQPRPAVSVSMPSLGGASAITSKVSPALFGLVVLAFFMPFMEISCSGQKIATLTGLNMVTGKSISSADSKMPGMGEAKKERIQPNAWAVLAFLGAIGGLAVSFKQGPKAALPPAILGGACFLLLLILKATAGAEATSGGGEMDLGEALTMAWKGGYWMALLFSLAAAGWNGFLLFQPQQE